MSRANARAARTAMYLNAIRPSLQAGDSLNVQPTTLGQGYGTAGSYAGEAYAPWGGGPG